MDPDSPVSRVERTLWTFWSYVTGAVNRFLNNIGNDPNSIQVPADDNESANCGHAEADASGRGVDEEQPLATVSLASLSRPIVAWDLCTTDINLGPDEESMQYKTQLSSGHESRASEEGEGSRGEQFTQTVSKEARLLVVKDAKEDELQTEGGDEMPENDEYEEHVNTWSLRLTGDAMNEYMEKSERKAGAEEETERAMTPDVHQNVDDTMTKIKVEEVDIKMQHEDEQVVEPEDLEVKLCTITVLSLEEDNMHKEEAATTVMDEDEENSDGVLLLASENEKKSDEGARQVENLLLVGEELSDDDRDFKEDPGFTLLHADIQMAYDTGGIVPEDELIVVGKERMTAHRSESEKAEDAKGKEEESTLDEREKGGVIEEDVKEAEDNQTIDEVPEQEDNIKTVTEDSQEEDILTGHVTCGKEAVQTTDISADERFVDKDQVEEKRLSGEVGNTESYMEIACTTTSVTVKPEGENGQEISEEFKNIPQGICEGQLVVSQELNSPTCEETQEGVPEYNNESGPDENTTQRFLEVGKYKETQTTQLPEEAESKETESLQNSGCSTGADNLLVREHMEEEQESSEDMKNSFDLVVEDDAGILHLTDAESPQETEKTLSEPANQESGLFFEEEEGELSVDSMKTVIKQSEKEFETEVGLTDETDKTTQELQGGTEELLVEFETDEGSCDSKEADAADRETPGAAVTEVVAGFSDETLKCLEVQKMSETRFLQESVDANNSEQNSNRTLSLLEDISEFGPMKQSGKIELTFLEDSSVEMQDAGIDMEETDYGAEVETAEDKMSNKNEMDILNLQVAGMAARPATENDEKVNTWTKNELSEEANVTKSEGSCAEETVCSISESQDVIDEETLDLWIQTALSEDTDGRKQQEGPEPGLQADIEIEPSKEEQDDISSVQTEKNKEPLVESNSGDSELVSDTEMSSSTVESGFLDQSLSEWGTQNSETQLPNSASTGSFQGIDDILANMSESADISELSTQQSNSRSPDELMEERAGTGHSYLKEEESITGFHPDSGVTLSEAGHLNQESEKSQEEIDAEVTDLAWKTVWKDTEEADIKSLTEMSAHFKVEETKLEDKPLEIMMCYSPDGFTHTESGRSRSGSEASSEERILSTEPGSHGDTCTYSEELLKLPSLDKPQPGWSEDVSDLLPGLNSAEVPTTESEDQMEVDTSALDFTAQRSRIAVKNPRARPPKDPRSLLHKPSVDPTPSSHLPVKVPAGVPMGGLGIGIKLPGLGAGFPVLKKTQRVVRDEINQETISQEPETKPEEKSDSPKQAEAQHKPKWMPPRGHPGFGNPLMSELKTKLKKTTKE